jgi:hypothetical protein
MPARVGKHVATFLLVLGSLWALWEGYKWLWESTAGRGHSLSTI